MRLVHVGVDPDLFKPMPDVARIPGRLITTASADVEMKGLRFLLEAMAKLRTERDVTLTVVGRAKEGGRW
ncbi:MAG: glycosyltransferase family 1 protein, partial [Actinomycetota bacterium]